MNDHGEGPSDPDASRKRAKEVLDKPEHQHPVHSKEDMDTVDDELESEQEGNEE